MMGKIKRLIAERRAAADVARMFSGSLSEGDVSKIINARESTEGYEENFLETLEADNCIEALSDDAVLMSLVEPKVKKSHLKLMESSDSSSRLGNIWPRLAVAASLVLAVVVGFFTYNQLSEEVSNISRYVTRTGEQKTVTLLDGSMITLNTGSQILVDVEGEKRVVTLDRGEAYFDVASDPERPFSVDLDGRMVTVLGTEFNIIKAPEGFTLAVTEGVVALHRENEAVSATAPEVVASEGEEVTLSGSNQRRFRAGMVAEFNVQQQSLIAYKPANMDRLIDWKSGVLRFEHELFSEVVLELNRYSAKKILIRDASLMDLKVFASIKIDDVSGALAVLERALPIKVVHQFDQILIVSP